MNLLMQSKNDEFNNYNFAASKIYQEYSKSLRPKFLVLLRLNFSFFWQKRLTCLVKPLKIHQKLQIW